MSIVASTLNQDRNLRLDEKKALFENGGNYVSAAITYNQGDMLCFDTGTDLIRAVAATTDAATFVGIAQVAVTAGVLNGPYTGISTAPALSQFCGPWYGITATMILKTGDSFVPGGKIYLADTLNCQTVSVTNPGDGNFIGLYDGPATVAVANQTGPVKIGCRYPNATGGAINF